MTRQVKVIGKKEKIINVTIDLYPNICPVCKDRVVPIWQVGATTERLAELQLVYQCTGVACRSLFIGYYNNQEPEVTTVYDLQGTRPIFPEQEGFADEVTDISPAFINIFNQAFAAEQHELDEIAGIGYRRALEFLVKDYAIKIHPGDKVNIEKKPLGQCVDKYIDDANLQAIAKRAV